MLFGPISRLRLYGYCCPFLESEGDSAFRLADMSLGVPIRWLRKVKHNTRRPTKSLFDSTICGGREQEVDPSLLVDSGAAILTEKTTDHREDNSNEVSESTDGNKETTSASAMISSSPYVSIDATLDLIDTKYGPSLRITSSKTVFVDDDWNGPDSGIQGTMSEGTVMTKTIALNQLDEASPGFLQGINGSSSDNAVILNAKSTGLVTKNKQILIFEVLPDSARSLTRDEVIKHINTLILWSKNDVIVAEEESNRQMVKEKWERKNIPQGQTYGDHFKDVEKFDTKNEVLGYVFDPFRL